MRFKRLKHVRLQMQQQMLKRFGPLKANQVQPLNKYPVVFVHGFLGLVGDNAPALYPNYWGQ